MFTSVSTMHQLHFASSLYIIIFLSLICYLESFPVYFGNINKYGKLAIGRMYNALHGLVYTFKQGGMHVEDEQENNHQTRIHDRNNVFILIRKFHHA